jgi:hypothetical protein
MVSEEEMAKVLSHPGYSHLNGSAIVSLIYRIDTYFLEHVAVYERPMELLLKKPDRRHHRYKVYVQYVIVNASRPFDGT